MRIYEFKIIGGAWVLEPEDIRGHFNHFEDHASPIELGHHPERWVVPKCVMREANNPDPPEKTDFYHWSSGNFCTDQPIIDELGIALACTFFPLKLPGREMFLANARNLIGVVDRDTSGGEYIDHTEGKEFVWKPERLAFFAEEIEQPGMFRVPEFRRKLFVATDGSGSDADFFTRYHQLGLRGFRFNPCTTKLKLVE